MAEKIGCILCRGEDGTSMMNSMDCTRRHFKIPIHPQKVFSFQDVVQAFGIADRLETLLMFNIEDNASRPDMCHAGTHACVMTQIEPRCQPFSGPITSSV